MRGINSLAGQLMLWIAGTITVLWLVAVAFGAFVMREEFGEIFDGVLQETAERLVPLALDDLLAQAKAGAALRRGSLPAEPGEGSTGLPPRALSPTEGRVSGGGRARSSRAAAPGRVAPRAGVPGVDAGPSSRLRVALFSRLRA